MMQFIPKGAINTTGLPDVPWFEDSAKNDIKGRRTEKPMRILQGEVERELAELGGFRVRFHEGEYIDNNRKRHGFRIEFFYHGLPSRIDVASLPMRQETPSKRDQAMRQSLFLLRDWLYAENVSWIYRPSAMPLLPYITGEDGRTMIETIARSGNLPLLGSGDSRIIVETAEGDE